MAAKGQCIGVCLGILAVATLLSTFTQFYTEEKIIPLDGACLRKYAFLARQDTLFVTIGANGLN